jgi:hypothetical protein
MIAAFPAQPDLKTDLETFIAIWGLGASRVLTQEEWFDRGELYGEGTPLVLITEDELYDSVNYNEFPALAKELEAIANKHGRYTERIHGWAISFPQQ